MDESPSVLSQNETILETQEKDDNPQPDIGGEDEGEFLEEEVAMNALEEDDKGLDEDELRSYHKVD